MVDEQRAAVRAQVAGGDAYPAELHRLAVVTAVATDGTVTIDIAEGGETAGPVATLDHYDPAVGDTVWALLRGADALVVGWQADGVTQRTLPAGLGPLPYAGTTAPPGWLLCNGQAVSRTTYARLFAVLSTTFGAGNGSSTFNMPNLTGRVPIGAGTLGSDTYARGGTGGVARHTLTVAEMPSHDHVLLVGGAAGGGAPLQLVGATNTQSRDQIVAEGGGGAHENRQPYLVVNYIIST